MNGQGQLRTTHMNILILVAVIKNTILNFGTHVYGMKYVLLLPVHFWTSERIRESYVKPCCQNCMQYLYETHDVMQHATKCYTFLS